MLDTTMSCQTQRLTTGTTDRMLERTLGRTLIDTTKQWQIQPQNTIVDGMLDRTIDKVTKNNR